jgi:hypothetical protein
LVFKPNLDRLEGNKDVEKEIKKLTKKEPKPKEQLIKLAIQTIEHRNQSDQKAYRKLEAEFS